jgi:hypothetical protein
MTAVATLTGALSRRMTVPGLQARMVKVGPQPGVHRGTTAFRKERSQGLSGMQGNLHVPFLGGCALQAHIVQPSAMAALTKRSQQSGTESCVGCGNAPGEA